MLVREQSPKGMESVSQVKVYSTTWCPYCDRAKALLESKGVEYVNINIEEQFADDPWGELERVTSGKSVPQIFIGDERVGGFDDLLALHRAGELDAKLQSV